MKTLALILALAFASPTFSEPPAKTECEACAADCLDQFNWDSYYIWTVWRIRSADCELIQDPKEWRDCVAANQRWLVLMLETLNKQYRLCGLACCCDPGGVPCPYDDEYIPPFYWEPGDYPKVPPNTPPRPLPEWWVPNDGESVP